MLYATGSTHEQIHKSTGISKGTIAARSSRDNWEAARKAVQATTNEALATVQAGLITKAERGQNWEARVEKQSAKVLTVLETQTPADIKSAGHFVDVLEKVDKVGRRSLGMESEGEGSKVIVNLGVLQESSPLKAEIIDISSEDCQKLGDSPSLGNG